MQKTYILFLLLLIGGPLRADILELSFNDLKASTINQWQDKEVQIRGFLYQRQDGIMLLAAQPNLRSCCLGSASKIEQQLIIKGHVKEVPYAQLMQGIFKIEPQFGAKGELTQLYVLENTRLIVPVSSQKIAIGIVSIIGCILYFFFKSWRFFNPRT
jgi:hypothetical protein